MRQFTTLLCLLATLVVPIRGSAMGPVATSSADLDGDGGMTLGDVIVLLQHVFGGAVVAGLDCNGDGTADDPATFVYPRGDVNGDSVVDVSDPIALLSHLFLGGNPPANSCFSAPSAVVVPGDDWSLPATVTPETNTGFYSEFLAPTFHVDTRSFDVTWRQINPAFGVYGTTATGGAQGMSFSSYDAQLADPAPFWMRLWTSGATWAPTWVPTSCAVSLVGPDYDGQHHLPIWNPCVWDHLLSVYRKVFIDWNLRADPRLQFVYAPGAFTWCEFDFDIVSDGVTQQGLTHAAFNTWFQQAMADLVHIMNGENSDPTDDYAQKLVFTGEDYPFGPASWGTLDDLFALDAVNAGMGIRTGITEVSNFHLNHVPAYGATVANDGHIVVDENWPLLNDGRIIATENECYTHCGYSTTDPYYAVKMSNLKALQKRVNWMYVVPSDSYMSQFPALWEWVRLSLGRQPATAPDAWVALRRAEDRYWLYDSSHTWTGAPWIQNLERWIVQRDVVPGGVSQLGSDTFTGHVDPDNGTATEGRRTDVGTNNNALYFDVDAVFLTGTVSQVTVKVTYRDAAGGNWTLDYSTSAGPVSTQAVLGTGTGAWQTATFTLAGACFDDLLPGACDLRITTHGSVDTEVRFLRVLR